MAIGGCGSGGVAAVKTMENIQWNNAGVTYDLFIQPAYKTRSGLECTVSAGHL